MKSILLIMIGVIFTAGPVWAEEYDEAAAYAICSLYIENQVPHFSGNPIPPGYKIVAPPIYLYQDLGESHGLAWNRAAPIYLANKSGRMPGEEGVSGAACEVDKKTGKIKYLAVSVDRL